MEQEEKTCCRCQEQFPVQAEPAKWTMGQLRELKQLPERFLASFKSFLQIPERAYFCGNCYFDLRDAEDED